MSQAVHKNLVEKKSLFEKTLYFAIPLLLLTGLFLSLIAWLEICVQHCSETKDYRFFGLSFSYLGIFFFSGTIILFYLATKWSQLTLLLKMALVGALGAEIWLIEVQRSLIGSWCPVCLSIAATLFLATILIFIYDNISQRSSYMSKLKLSSIYFLVALFGFLTSFLGVSKFDYLQASINEIQAQVALGNKSSDIKFYFVSDWFCPSCKKVEPTIDKLYTALKDKVEFFFVDYAIHKKSMNFTPYNLSFLMNNKDHYLKARDALIKLAASNENPTDSDIEAIAKKNNFHFEELSFTQVNAGVEFFEKIVKDYKLKATPVVVLVNKRNNHVMKFEGASEIKEDNILKAVKMMEEK